MNLSDLRKKKGLTQKQLSEASGVPLRMVQHYEQGVKDINKAEARKIYHLSKALDCRMEDFIVKTKYEVKKDTIEVSYKNRHTIKSGIIFTSDCGTPKLIASFDTLEEAQEELNKHKSSICPMSGPIGTLYEVDEFYIEEAIYDDEDEWTESRDLYLLPFTADELSKIDE